MPSNRRSLRHLAPSLVCALAVLSACSRPEGTSGGPQGVTVVVAPTSAVLGGGESARFTASVTGSVDTSVVWSVQEGAVGGSVAGTGLYTAPGASGVYHVVATSRAEPTLSAAATVTVNGASGTAVSAGPITTQAWTAAGSPYRIYGDVYVPSGHRLTIQPGVQVRFQGHYRLEGPGTIDARGTSAARRDILFTAENAAIGWYGIRIWNRTGAVGVAPDIADYHLENCIIEWVVKDRSSPRAFGDAIYNDSRGALYVYGATAYAAGAPESYAGLKYSDLHLNGLLLRHNRALVTQSPAGEGGGIYFNTLNGGSQPVWTDVEFDDNWTVAYGGAIATHHSGAITFLGGAMTNNVATAPEQAGAGGAIGYWDVVGPITLDHVTYSGNTPAGFATAGAPSVVVVNPP